MDNFDEFISKCKSQNLNEYSEFIEKHKLETQSSHAPMIYKHAKSIKELLDTTYKFASDISLKNIQEYHNWLINNSNLNIKK